ADYILGNNRTSFKHLKCLLTPLFGTRPETLYAETCIPQLNAFFTTWVRGRSYVPNYSNKARESGSMRALMKGLLKSASDILQSAPEKCVKSE
ncbi:hypothetical protein, partial [Atopobium sp. BS2]|uniref:hypothetical protein n=1 Tax=Atopobium sp. BS2 TaxID=936550 RepID=UPI001E479F03